MILKNEICWNGVLFLCHGWNTPALLIPEKYKMGYEKQVQPCMRIHMQHAHWELKRLMGKVATKYFETIRSDTSKPAKLNCVMLLRV